MMYYGPGMGGWMMALMIFGNVLFWTVLILGVVMVESAFILAFNLLIDIAYAWLDPRIDLSAKAA